MNAADTTARAAPVALIVLRVVLAAFFVFVAVRNLGGDEQMAADFDRWGYPDWFRQLTAWLQIAGAVLLLVPGVTFGGAALLCCVLLGAVGTHLMHDPPKTLLAPVVFLVLVAPLVWAYRPALLR